jgi:hypothetical protein
MNDIWVSATGQFLIGLQGPNSSGQSFTLRSTDYGVIWTSLLVDANNTTVECIGGSANGEIIALGSNWTNTAINPTPPLGDGKLRIYGTNKTEVVQGVETVGLNESAMINGIVTLTPTTQLWARGEGYQAGAGGNYFCPFNGAAKINLSEYNIGYKIEFYWAPGNIYPSHWNQLGINNYTSVQPNYNQGSNGGYTAVTNMQNFHTTASDYNWTFTARSYCGFQQNTSTTSLANRYSTLLTGTLSMNHRPENAPDYGGIPASAGANVGTNDWSVFSKVLKNDFVCDNYSIITANSNYQYDWGVIAGGSGDYPNTYCSVRGQSLWDMTYGGIYYNGGADSIQNGVFRLFIRNTDNYTNNDLSSPLNPKPRNAYMKYQIYRIRK